MNYVLLDQVQLLDELESVLNSLIRMKNVDVGVIVLNKTNEKGHGIRKQLAIDFVCNKGSKRYYIQSAYAIPDRRKMEQRSLMLTGGICGVERGIQSTEASNKTEGIVTTSIM